MTMGWSAPRKAAAALALAGIGAGGFAAPAMAQDEARVRKLEAEVTALQRAVFPGGDQRFFPPEVTPGSQVQPASPAITPPSATALTDVLARLDSLEGQVSRLTAQSEEKDHQLTLLQKRFDDAQAALAAQSAPPGPPAADSAAVQPTGVIPVPSIDRGPVTAASVETRSPARSARRAAEAAAAGDADAESPRLAQPTKPAARAARQAPVGASPGPSAARLAAVRGVVKPQTSDAGDDEYTYGFRLFGAGFYPEARQQLSLYLQKYPDHREVSFARNLLGRAYLDDGQPREAAKYFFDNYQSNKNGPRAADSLLNLADSMIAINDTGRACIALAEFGDTYPAIAGGRLKEQYDRTRSKVHCTK